MHFLICPLSAQSMTRLGEVKTSRGGTKKKRSSSSIGVLASRLLFLKMYLLKPYFIISAALQSYGSHGARVAWESMRECMKEFPSVRLFESRSSCWRGAGSVTRTEVRARPSCSVTSHFYFMPKNWGRRLQRGQSRRQGSPEITPAHWSFLILHRQHNLMGIKNREAYECKNFFTPVPQSTLWLPPKSQEEVAWGPLHSGNAPFHFIKVLVWTAKLRK